jgi:hypothetical protein
MTELIKNNKAGKNITDDFDEAALIDNYQVMPIDNVWALLYGKIDVILHALFVFKDLFRISYF